MKRELFISSVVDGGTVTYASFDKKDAINHTKKVFNERVSFYNGFLCMNMKIENQEANGNVCFLVKGKGVDCCGNVTEVIGEVSVQMIEC